MPPFKQHRHAALAIVNDFAHLEWADDYSRILQHLPDECEWTATNIERATLRSLNQYELPLASVEPFLCSALVGTPSSSKPIFTIIEELGPQTAAMRVSNPRNTSEWQLILESDIPKIVSGSAVMEAVAY